MINDIANNIAKPHAVIREINQLEEMDEFQLHDLAIQEDKKRSNSMLRLAEIWCQLEDNSGYTKLGSGYKSMAEYVKHEFDKSKSTMVSIMRV